MVAAAVLLLCTLWVAGISTRSVWTPDEPREYALALSMWQQPNLAVPLLAGEPFLEKPPLTYWAAAAAMALAGRNAVAARLPNLLYGLITVLATAWLAAGLAPAAMRARSATLAALLIGTAWLPYLHTIWLATDAPYLAASALAIAALWQALAAGTVRRRWACYALFHFSLGLAFLARNMLGLLAPLMALGLFILWQRRWRELLRAPLWFCGLIPVAMIGGWAMAVRGAPDGNALLRIAFWDNSIGRFLPVATTGDYRSGHLNSPGKLLRDVALAMLPWLLVILAGLIATLRLAWQRHATARFLLVASLPLPLLLSFSSTVRDVYALPVVAPLCVSAALWAVLAPPTGGWYRICLTCTRVALYGLGSLLLLLALSVPLIADGQLPTAPLTWIVLVGGLVLIVGSLQQLGALRLPVLRGLAAYAVGLYAALLLATPVIERGQDLRPTARAAVLAADHRAILLPAREETMRAALFYGAGISAATVSDFGVAAQGPHPVAALLEVPTDRLTPAMRARLAHLAAALGKPRLQTDEPQVQQLQAQGWVQAADFPNPGGRHYVLLVPPGAR